MEGDVPCAQFSVASNGDQFWLSDEETSLLKEYVAASRIVWRAGGRFKADL